MPHPERGFTLVELVVIIVILGVMAAIVIPRFAARDGFDSRGFYDRATATVRFAQKTAVAWRRPVFVCVTATQVTAGTAAGCATPLTNPVSGTPAQETAPSGVTLSPVSFSFDALGQASATAVVNFNSSIAGDPTRTITITAATGYVAAN